MSTVLRGRAWRFGDNVDTDQIIPAKYAIFSLDEKKLGEHAMEGVPDNEGWSQRVAPGDIVVGDENGVVVVPFARCEEILHKAEQLLETEHLLQEKLRAGGTIGQLVGVDEIFAITFAYQQRAMR